MFPDSCKCDSPYLLLRILDTVPIRLCRRREILQTCRPLPDCFRLDNACLSGSAYLTDRRFSNRCGNVNFSASLHLPLCVTLITSCGRQCVEGEICLPVCAILRCSGHGNEQILPEVSIYVHDARRDCGGLSLCLDIDVTLYVTCLTPAALSCTQVPACSPAPRPCPLPLYPELPFH